MGSAWPEVVSKLSQYEGTGNAKANFDFAPGTYYLGSSILGSTVPATGLGVPPALFGAGRGEVTGFSLYKVIPIPEPSPAALLLVGLAGWVLTRRTSAPS